MYQCQLDFAMFCTTSALGISLQHLNHPNLLVRSVYRFYVYFYVRLILHDLGISLPHEDGFSKVKNSYIKSVFKSTFKALINEDYSIVIVIERYQGVLEHALLKVDFSVGTGIYMLLNDLNLNTGKTKRYNNKFLVSNKDMKIGSNRDINKDHKKLPPPDDDMPKIMIPAIRHDNTKMLTEKHNDEKLLITLLIVGAWLITYHFW